MGDAVMRKLMTDFFFYRGKISVSYYMHSSTVTEAVHSPDVYMMNIGYTFDSKDMLLNFLYGYTVRCFFEKDLP